MSALTFLIVAVIKIAITLGVLLTVVAYTVWLERKVVGRMQNRWGPSRVGPFGLLQPLADGAKFLLKEDLTPPYVEKHLYLLAPALAVIMALTSIAMIPIGPIVHLFGISTPVQITGVVDAAGQAGDINIGILVILGITSLGVYGIALAGWSSNSKYSLLGSLRASAQMVSYEVSLGLSLVGVLIVCGTLSLNGIVQHQAVLPHHMLSGFGPLNALRNSSILHWNIFRGGQFFAFFLYMIAAFAETNRIPFDLPEAETELVAGYHTEYSAMKFAMFFMAEYANMVTVACVASVMFLGGWSGPALPFLPQAVQAFLPLLYFSAKIFFFLFLYIWIRGTLPRFRYDQLMAFGWKVLFPAALANVIITAFFVAMRG
jgi:NADH-quinone oxidoreductase subunit H